MGTFSACIAAVFAGYRGEIIPGFESAMLALMSIIPARVTVPVAIDCVTIFKEPFAATLARMRVIGTGLADLLARNFLQFLVHFILAPLAHRERRTFLAHHRPLSSYTLRLFLG
jgi:hypothetical protein